MGPYTNHVATKRGEGDPQKTTTLHNSYLVKVATLGGEGVKILKKMACVWPHIWNKAENPVNLL